MSQLAVPDDTASPETTVVDGRYRLRREIARGAACAVHEATHMVTGRTVALKQLLPDHRNSAPFRARLVREARCLAALQHPHIVQVLDAGNCQHAGPYLALEMLEGRPLDGLLTTRTRLVMADVAHLGRQLLQALAHMHARGLVHRDLKPANLFVAKDATGEERLRILDLGVVGRPEEPERKKLTLAGEVIGTAEYMAPEQLLATGEVHPGLDVYAAGVTLFECLSGEVPYSGSYPEVLVKVSAKQPRPRLVELRPDVPRAVSDVIERALALDHRERFANAIEFGEAWVSATKLDRGRSCLLGTPPRPLFALRRSPPPLPPVGDDANPENGPAPDGASRRRFTRAPYVTPIRIIYPDGYQIDGRTEDISEGGLLALTERPCRDADARVKLALPLDGRMVEVNAHTRWTRRNRGQAATGLQFEGLGAQERLAIGRYIELMGRSY